MTDRPFWAWLEHRMKFIYSTKLLGASSNDVSSSTYEQDVQIDSFLNNESTHLPIGGLPIVFIFGGFNPLPHVEVKGILNYSADKFTDSSGFLGGLILGQSSIYPLPTTNIIWLI